jgi:hypothetical protein
MKLFKVYNTSSDWWVIAPNEEIAIKYSFQNTSTREERNLGISSLLTYSLGKRNYYINEEMLSAESGLHELLEGNRVGIAVCIEINDSRKYKWKFTVSHELSRGEFY